MKHPDFYAQIEAYLCELLSPEAKHAFEQALQRDEALQAALDAHQAKLDSWEETTPDEAVDRLRVHYLAAEARDAWEGLQQAEGQRSRPLWAGRGKMLAVAAAVALLAGVWFWQRKPEGQPKGAELLAQKKDEASLPEQATLRDSLFQELRQLPLPFAKPPALSVAERAAVPADPAISTDWLIALSQATPRTPAGKTYEAWGHLLSGDAPTCLAIAAELPEDLATSKAWLLSLAYLEQEKWAMARQSIEQLLTGAPDFPYRKQLFQVLNTLPEVGI